MSITFLKRDSEFGQKIDFVQLLENGSIHYVSVAMPGLTVASHNIEFAGGFDTHQRNDFMMKVNRAKETGTLYPRVNITLLPSPRASYLGMDSHVYNDGDYPSEDVVAHIHDAFKANWDYIKSDKMYFDFRNLYVSEFHYVSCLEEAMESFKAEDMPAIITWKPQ